MNKSFAAIRVLLGTGFVWVMVGLSSCNCVFPREKQILLELALSGGQYTINSGKCSEILKTEDWCNVIKGVTRITRPQWEELFPKTRFYLVKAMSYSGESELQNNFLIIEQAGGRFTDKTFDQLLDMNGIVIGDENRELVAKALALITLPDYLKNEITFTSWEKDTTPPAPFDYCLTAWTKIEGRELKWCFFFSNLQYRLIVAGPMNLREKTGDFIEAPEFTLPYPKPQYYYFRRE